MTSSDNEVPQAKFRGGVSATAVGVTYRPWLILPQRIIPVEDIRAVTTRSGRLMSGSFPVLLLRSGSHVLLVGAGDIIDAEWNAKDIARALNCSWVSWRKKELDPLLRTPVLR